MYVHTQLERMPTICFGIFFFLFFLIICTDRTDLGLHFGIQVQKLEVINSVAAMILCLQTLSNDDRES